MELVMSMIQASEIGLRISSWSTELKGENTGIRLNAGGQYIQICLVVFIHIILAGQILSSATVAVRPTPLSSNLRTSLRRGVQHE